MYNSPLRYEVSPLGYYLKDDHLAAYMISHPDLREELQLLDKQQHNSRAHECTSSSKYGVSLNGRMCTDYDAPISPALVSRYIQLERELAFMATTSIAFSFDIDTSIPVLYLPDGGTHIALGASDSLRKSGRAHTIYSCSYLKEKPGIPLQAIEHAQEANGLLLCDSVIDKGEAAARMLSAVPPASEIGKQLTFFVYFSHATSLNSTGAAGDYFDDAPVKGLPKLQAAVSALGHQLQFYTSRIGSWDPFDRADAILYAAQSRPEMEEYVALFPRRSLLLGDGRVLGRLATGQQNICLSFEGAIRAAQLLQA